MAKKSFASKTVSLIGRAIKGGAKITVKGTIAIGKLTVLAARKVGSAFASAIKSAIKSAREKLNAGKAEKPLKSRQTVKIENVKEAQKNLAAAIRNGKETIAKQKAAQKDRREIASLERRAKALKQDSPLSTTKTKQPNQDYTNFEKSRSTLSANATLTSKDKKDIAELEARLANLKKP